ncbi:hypothetical protein WDU94_014225 [Cyamophila willieti]
MRKLKVSNKLEPYLERHRIVELFSHLTRQILTDKPKDVLRFVRNELVATEGNFVSKVILLGPPDVNVSAIADYVSEQMNIAHITLEHVSTAHYYAQPNANVSEHWMNVISSELHSGHLSQENNMAPASNLLNPNKEDVLDCKALAETLLKLLSNNNSNGWILTVRPRVVLFGPRGSGKRSLGQKLEENLHIIHIDMTPNRFSTQQKKIEELLVRLGEDDCLRLGYVLTGFPRNVDELRKLDQSVNPPNRIIFLTLADDICLKRHGERCFDINTCREMKRSDVRDTGHAQCMNMNRMIATHPNDDIEQIKADLQAYRNVEQELMKYIGKNALFIDANTCNLNILYERVASVIQRPLPVSQDRTCEPENKSQETNYIKPKREQDTPQPQPQCDGNKWKFTMKFKCPDKEPMSCDLEQIKRILRDE